MADTTNGNGTRINVLPWWPVIVIVLGGAAAWGDLRTAQSYHNERIDRLERKDEAANVAASAVLQRLVSVEAELRAVRSLLERQYQERR